MKTVFQLAVIFVVLFVAGIGIYRYSINKSLQEEVSTNKEFVQYKQSNHVILYDYDAKDALCRVMDFLLKDRPP
ncbi:MAG: hypothetical protein L6420_08775 [Elusimicrobia bacterium]|nr:hypothetical protein [Elusimicrobiota bacterium]